MEYLIFAGIAIVSGFVSSLVTLFAVSMLNSNREKNTFFRGRVASLSTDANLVEKVDISAQEHPDETVEQPLIETENLAPEPLHLSLLNALHEDSPKGYNKKFSLKFFYKKILLSAHLAVDTLFAKIFSTLFFVASPVFVPAHLAINYLEREPVKLPKIKFKKSGNPISKPKVSIPEIINPETAPEPGKVIVPVVATSTTTVKKDSQAKTYFYGKIKSFFKKIFFAKNKTNKFLESTEKTVVQKPVKVLEGKIKQKAYNLSIGGESKLVTRSIYAEIMMSLVPVASVILPFMFGFHKGSAENLFTYLGLVAILGSGLLLYAKSPRSFWAVGITLWTAVAYYFFNWKVDSSIGPATIFITLFLGVYAVSGYIWYGLRERLHAEMEYGLYILHPLIYLSALYLLIASRTPYIIVLVYISVAALYAYFAQTVSFKYPNSIFTQVCWFIVVVALASSVIVAVSGASEILLLSALYVYLINRKNKVSAVATLPILFFIVLRTLDVTNNTKTFVFLLNERFVGYVAAVGALVFSYLQAKNNKIDLGSFTKMFKRLMAALGVMLSYFAVTLEVLDAKTNSTIFPGKSAVFVLLAIYLSMAIGLYIFGKKHKEKSVLGLSLVLSLYSVYFISKYLL